VRSNKKFGKAANVARRKSIITEFNLDPFLITNSIQKEMKQSKQILLDVSEEQCVCTLYGRFAKGAPLLVEDGLL